MARQVSAADAGRQNDDAVRRIRDESARRIEGRRRRRAFSSWCALATLAGGISLAAMDARETRLRERAEAEEVARQAATEKSLLEDKLRAIQRDAEQVRSCRIVQLERIRDERERAREWVQQESERIKRGKRKGTACHFGNVPPSALVDNLLRDFR